MTKPCAPNRFVPLTFRRKLTVSYLVLVFIPMLILIFVYFSMGSRMIERLTVNLTERSLDQTVSYMGTKLELETVIADLMTVNNEVFTLLSTPYSSYILAAQIDDARKLEQYVRNVLDRNPDIHRIKVFVSDRLIYANENTILFNLNSVTDQEWLEALQKKNGALHWIVKREGRESVLSAARYVRSFQGELGSDALVEVQIKSSLLTGILNQGMISDSGMYVLADDADSILLASSERIRTVWNDVPSLRAAAAVSFDAGRAIGVSESVVLRRILEPWRWELYFIIPMKDLLAQNERFQRYSILILVVISFVILSLAYVLSGYSAKRIERLNSKMERVRDGDLEVKLMPGGHDEIGKLERSFTYMVQSIRQHLEREIAMTREVKNAELKALQSQINPHFLYNTLELINWMVDLDKKEEAHRLVHSLASFYKISLGKGHDLIPIREELEHVRRYVDIQNVRYDNRIRLTVAADRSVLDVNLCKILLQPIVENSIQHGIAPKADKTGHIEIGCRTVGASVEFTVADDGIGMEPDKLRDILEGNPRHAGYGIRNVRERLLLYYGKECDFRMKSRRGRGTVVRFRVFPLDR